MHEFRKIIYETVTEHEEKGIDTASFDLVSKVNVKYNKHFDKNERNLLMYRFPIGVILESFRTDTKTALAQAAAMASFMSPPQASQNFSTRTGRIRLPPLNRLYRILSPKTSGRVCSLFM